MRQCIAQRPTAPPANEVLLQPVVDPHSVNQAVLHGDIDEIDELVVVKLANRGASLIEDSDGLERETVRVPGMMRSRCVLDCQLEDIADFGKALR
jgi:hypothetical protein